MVRVDAPHLTGWTVRLHFEIPDFVAAWDKAIQFRQEQVFEVSWQVDPGFVVSFLD